MRRIQDDSKLFVDGVVVSHDTHTGVIDDQQAVSLTTMQAAVRSAASTFDSTILHHFGDGPVLSRDVEEDIELVESLNVRTGVDADFHSGGNSGKIMDNISAEEARRRLGEV